MQAIRQSLITPPAAWVPIKRPRPAPRKKKPIILVSRVAIHVDCVKKIGSYEAIGIVLDRRVRQMSRRKRRYWVEGKLYTWSRAVKKRDKCCVECGSTENLTAHHIKPKSQYPELAFELSNGKTLCRFCHRLEHPELPDRMFFPVAEAA